MSDTKTIEVEKQVEGKTVLSFDKPSPKWATWFFRIVFILTGVITFIVVSDPGIADSMKIRLSIYLKAADMLVWGITRAIGVEVNRDYNLPDEKTTL